MENKVLEFLKELRPECDFESSNDFIEDGLLDSVDVIELMAMIEEEFDCDIPGTEVIPENFASLKDIVSIIERCKNAWQ